MKLFHAMSWFAGLASLSLAACGDMATLPVSAGSGLHPTLPPPVQALIPTVNIAPATGWPAGTKPTSAPSTGVAAFADGLDHPRWLYVLPNGDVMVAETNAPPKPDGGLPVDVLTGFLDEKGNARGRPVGVALDKYGALLVADDVGNVIWRVTGQ